jgi:hypothetical protein
MSYTLPDWLELDKSELRAECGLMPHQVEADADDARLETIITGHIATQAARVLGEVRRAAGRRSFPSTTTELERAYPCEISFPVIVEYDSSLSRRIALSGAVIDAAYTLAIPANTTLNFPRVYGDPETQVAPAQGVIDAAVAAWQVANAERITDQQELAKLAVTSHVYAKLWYTIAPPDSEYMATAINHYKTGQQLLGSLKQNLGEIAARIRLRSCPFV